MGNGVTENDGEWNERPQEINVLRDDVGGFVCYAPKMARMKAVTAGFAFVGDLPSEEGRQEGSALIAAVAGAMRAMSMIVAVRIGLGVGSWHGGRILGPILTSPEGGSVLSTIGLVAKGCKRSWGRSSGQT